MLETRFPRIPGDVGHGETWPFPVMLRKILGASVHRVVNQGAEGLVEAFVEAGLDLVAQGADGITTSCGFMALHQQTLKARLPVPVATSSLLQVQMVNSLLGGGKRAGVVTANRASLSEAHLKAVHVPSDTPIAGLEDSEEFARVILGDETVLDVEKASEEVTQAALRLQQEHPEVGALVLECTNMAPYAPRLRQVTGLPVYSIYSMILWFQAGLQPRVFPRGITDSR